MTDSIIPASLYDTTQHSPSIEWDSFSDRQVWRSICSCGWDGLIVCSEPSEQLIPIEWKEFIEENGKDVLLNVNEVYGNEAEALVQILDHLNYSEEKDRYSSIERLTKTTSALKDYWDPDADYSTELYGLSDDLSSASEEFAAYKRREHIWKTIPIPEVRKDAEEKRQRLLQFYVQLSEEHQSSVDS